MKIETKIRAAYLRAHENDVFSINITGNIRLLLRRNQDSNATIYSGNGVRLVGDGYAYWKAEDGFFVCCGSKHELDTLLGVMKTFEVNYCTCAGHEVISLRERPTTATKRVSLEDYVAASTAAGELTAYDKAVLARGDYREVV